MAAEDRTLIQRFLSALEAVPEIEAVVLFGSFARGEAGPHSDIDLLLVVDLPDPGVLRRRIARLIGGLSPHRDLNPVLTNLHDTDPSFLRRAFEEGFVLRGRVVLTPDRLALEPRVLVAYDLSRLAPSEKVRVSRLVHGFRSEKTVKGRRRTYKYPGLRDRYGAEIVSRSVLLAKAADAQRLLKELDELNVRYTARRVYT